jgi:hypothetical protein
MTTTEELPPKHRFKGEMTAKHRDRIERIRAWCEEMLSVYGFVSVTHVERVFDLPRSAARKDFAVAMAIILGKLDKDGPVLSRSGAMALKKLTPFVYHKPPKPPKKFKRVKMLTLPLEDC